MEKVSCGNCKHWKDEWPELKPDDDDVGSCQVMKDVILPYSWRYTTREIMWTRRGEWIECQRYESRD